MSRLPWLVTAFALAAGSLHAQESMKDWLARILDPATIDVAPYDGAALNRKLTVDSIRYEREHPEKKIAVYIGPLDKLPDAKAHFAKVLGIPAQSPGTDTKGVEKVFFDCTGAAKCPAKAKGLTIQLGRSPWVDGMMQIQFELPGSKP